MKDNILELERIKNLAQGSIRSSREDSMRRLLIGVGHDFLVV